MRRLVPYKEKRREEKRREGHKEKGEDDQDNKPALLRCEYTPSTVQAATACSPTNMPNVRQPTQPAQEKMQHEREEIRPTSTLWQSIPTLIPISRCFC